MPLWMGRLIMVVLGMIFMAGSYAFIKPSVQRGYFLGRHGQHFSRGEPSYALHCVLLMGCFVAGVGFVGAGVFLPADKLMRRN
ncbi:hypothetical protein ABS71_15810 [bacterium SCN 62-11]|nr:MAG: hypothetical protein ABS71_15810 [bacterium SCN 62-11]